MEKNKIMISSLMVVLAVSLMVLFVNSISVQAVKSGSCQVSGTKYCGQQSPVDKCWCDSLAIGYGDNCADIQTVCPEIASGAAPQSPSVKSYSVADIPSQCETFGAKYDTICDDTKENCASGYEDNSDPACMECTTGKWSKCNKVVSASTPSGCKGYVDLVLSTTTPTPGQTVTASVTKLDGDACNGKEVKFNFYKQYDTSSQKYTCSIVNGKGCSVTFAAPLIPGIYFMFATADVDGNYNEKYAGAKIDVKPSGCTRQKLTVSPAISQQKNLELNPYTISFSYMVGVKNNDPQICGESNVFTSLGWYTKLDLYDMRVEDESGANTASGIALQPQQSKMVFVRGNYGGASKTTFPIEIIYGGIVFQAHRGPWGSIKYYDNNTFFGESDGPNDYVELPINVTVITNPFVAGVKNLQGFVA